MKLSDEPHLRLSADLPSSGLGNTTVGNSGSGSCCSVTCTTGENLAVEKARSM